MATNDTPCETASVTSLSANIADRYTSPAWLEAANARLWPRVWRMVAPAVDQRTFDAPRVETFAGLSWINSDPHAGSLRAWLGPVAPLIEAYDLGAMTLESDMSMVLACNWKASVDAHNEGYHVHTLHPEILSFVDDTAVELALFGPHGRMIVPMGRPSGRRPGATVPADLRVQSDNHMFYIFPNLQLNCYADHAMIFRHQPHPTDPGICRFDQQILRRGDGPRRASAHRTLTRHRHSLGPVTDADLDVVEQLQLGMMGRGFDDPVWSQQEAFIAHMHANLEAWLS